MTRGISVGVILAVSRRTSTSIASRRATPKPTTSARPPSAVPRSGWKGAAVPDGGRSQYRGERKNSHIHA